MAPVLFRSDIVAENRDHMGGDESIIQAMLVSSNKDHLVEEMMDIPKTEGRIKFLMRKKHGSVFEHNALKFYVEAPIFVFREWHRHRIGWCLPGDSQIAVGTWRNGQTKRLEDVYRDWYEGVTDTMGRTRHLQSCRNLVTRTLNLDTGFIEATRMVDVYKSGIKPIVRIVLESGRTLRCTPDHQIWSPDGWVKARDITINDLIGRQGRVAIGERQGIPKRLREGIQFWTTEQKIERIQPVDSCYICEGIFLRSELELDHVTPVKDDLRLALDIDNLQPICAPCHQIKTNNEGIPYRKKPLTLGVRFEQVVDIHFDGEEMTYDIEMPGPWHNFIANDFIVHNSYNEQSGRYSELPPMFYIPPANRPLVQVGKPGAYTYVSGKPLDYEWLVADMEEQAISQYFSYQRRLERGIAKEVARMSLGVNIYSKMYATCNARSLMAFLSLRTNEPDATFPSTPMWEIEAAARMTEHAFASLFPITYNAWNEYGRVAP